MVIWWKNQRKKILGAFLVSLALTLVAASGIWSGVNQAACDAWYQHRMAAGGEIVLVGIDQKALEELGPYNQWGRDIMARAIEALNQTEESRPAVIGVDVLYVSENQAETDRQLAQAAGRYGNVVMACAADFGIGLTPDGRGDYRLEDFSVRGFEEAYPALRREAAQGHINAMLDGDGILRHHLLRFALPDGREIPSMALAVAERFREALGESLDKLPPTNGRGFWYVPFYGKPGDLGGTVSLADLLEGRTDPDLFAGKIVLIGPYAPALQDSFFTSIDHAVPMFGIEYHANVVQALLDGNFKREAGGRIQFLVLFMVLFLGTVVFWKRPVQVSFLAWLLGGGGYLLLSRLLYHYGLVLHVLWIPAGLTVLYIGCLAFNYIQAALEKRRVTRTFKRYVAPEIVNEILKEGEDALELGGKLTRIAVLFVDVRGFTPMSEMLKPAQVVEILNRYLTLISDCILRNGGTLDKFVGDAAMAFWGAPVSQEDYVMKAVQAAADMVKGSKALSEELERRYGRRVAFGIGVHVGEAVVGNIGSPERMDYTAIGDTVNTAARLEANAPGGTVYISRAVADELGGRIQATSLGDTVKLKGKKEGFEVLVLDGICG